MHTNSTHSAYPDIVKRLRRAVGQLNSVIAMVEEGRPCCDVAMHMQMMQGMMQQMQAHMQAQKSMDQGK